MHIRLAPECLIFVNRDKFLSYKNACALAKPEGHSFLALHHTLE